MYIYIIYKYNVYIYIMEFYPCPHECSYILRDSLKGVKFVASQTLLRFLSQDLMTFQTSFIGTIWRKLIQVLLTQRARASWQAKLTFPHFRIFQANSSKKAANTRKYGGSTFLLARPLRCGICHGEFWAKAYCSAACGDSMRQHCVPLPLHVPRISQV